MEPTQAIQHSPRLTPNVSFASRPDSRRPTGNSLYGDEQPHDSDSRRPSFFGGLPRASFSAHKKNLIEFLQRHGSKLSLNKKDKDDTKHESLMLKEIRDKNRAVA